MPAHKPSPISPPPEADNPEEAKRFIDMAREVEADESPDAVDRAFDRVMRPPLGQRQSRKLSASTMDRPRQDQSR